MERTALIAAYRDQIRDRVVPGSDTTRVGPLLRDERGQILYRDLAGLEGPDVDALIAAEREHFAAVGRAVEWKYHTDDLPADLPERLARAGFTPGEEEQVMVGSSVTLAEPAKPAKPVSERLPEGVPEFLPELPPGVTMRQISSRDDLERVRRMEETIWSTDHAWLPEALHAEITGNGDPCVVVVVEAEGDVVCAGWVRLHVGTDFASLWGGSTLPAWRGKGLYRATVRDRANRALAAGYSLVQVDASPESRPILEGMGLSPIATTVPYTWTPPPSVP